MTPDITSPGKRTAPIGRLLCALAMFILAAGSAWADDAVYASHGMADATPAQVYLRYVEVAAAADSVEDILPFSPFTEAKNRKDLEAMPLAQRKQALGFIKAMALVDAEVLSEQVDGDTATLEVRGQSPGMLSGELEPTWGTISLVRKAGEWKITNRAFRDKPQAGDA